MSTTRLSPGDIEQLAKAQSEQITRTIEMMLPRFLPGIVDYVAACDECGALAFDQDKHAAWHLLRAEP